MVRAPQTRDAAFEVPLAPLIDCVFLLLIYFMVTATLHRQEMDLSFVLPVAAQPQEAITLPAEEWIELTAAGQPMVHGRLFDNAGNHTFPELTAMLANLRIAAEQAGQELSLVLAPTPATPHQAVVAAMDAAARAGVTQVRFAESDRG